MADRELHPFTPDWTLRPGVFLRRVLKDRKLQPEDLCLTVNGGMHLEVVSGILDGTARVDEDAAIRLANGTGVPSSFWLNSQAQYDADIARGAAATSEEHEND